MGFDISNLILREKYGKNKKNLFNSSSAETAHNVVDDSSQMSVRKKKKCAPK